MTSSTILPGTMYGGMRKEIHERRTRHAVGMKVWMAWFKKLRRSFRSAAICGQHFSATITNACEIFGFLDPLPLDRIWN